MAGCTGEALVSMQLGQFGRLGRGISIVAVFAADLSTGFIGSDCVVIMAVEGSMAVSTLVTGSAGVAA